MASLPIEADKHAAVILAYQKIDAPLSEDTSLSADQFQAQMTEILTGGYVVMPLDEVVRHFQEGEELPLRSVAITFDGPYRSAYDEAFPLLIKHRLPFTIFVSPQLMNSPRPNTVGWDELRSLAAKYDFISFGLHPYYYKRMASETRASISASLNTAQKRFAREMGNLRPVPSLFAYPFGAYSMPYRDSVAEGRFEAAFTLSSGVAHKEIDFMQLPRFAMTDTYGALERFRMILNAAPLPVSDWQPAAFYRLEQDNPPIDTISFQITQAITALDLLQCFVSGQDKPVMQMHDTPRNLVILKLHQPLESGRTRINCTMPAPPSDDILDPPRYRWHGMLYSIE